MTTELKAPCANKRLRQVWALWIGYPKQVSWIGTSDTRPTIVPWDPITYDYSIRFADTPVAEETYGPALFFSESAALEYAEYMSTNGPYTGRVYSVAPVDVHSGLSESLKYVYNDMESQGRPGPAAPMENTVVPNTWYDEGEDPYPEAAPSSTDWSPYQRPVILSPFTGSTSPFTSDNN